MPPIEIKAASPNDLRKVLRLTLATRHQPATDLERHVTTFIRFAREMALDLSRNWVCMDGDHMVAACSCIETPGRTAMLLLPNLGASKTRTRTISDMVRHVIGRESTRDIRLMQCLIQPDDVEARTTLEHVGFRHVATLTYMEWKDAGRVSPQEAMLPAGIQESSMEWITYDDAHHGEFARLIEDTYHDTLDCPDLCGLRDINDVIAGHKAAGRFLPHRWLLLRYRGRPVGCILLGENTLRPALELVYMGIHPDWRRTGVGRFLLSHGLSMARREGFTAVTLAVDDTNKPALALYKSAGFRETVRRGAMIYDFDSSFDTP